MTNERPSSRPGRPFLAAAATAASALVLLAGFPLFRLWTLMWTQLEHSRTLGLLAVIAALVLAAGLVVATVARVLPMLPPMARPWLQAAFWAGVLFNLALIGLQVYFPGPFHAPRTWQVAAVLGPLALAAVFLRYGEAERAMIVGGAIRVGQVLLAIPLLALPWVAWGAAHDAPRLAGAPEPPPASAMRADAPRRIILVTYDALRYQSTSIADPRLATTPHLAALAREGTAFTQARAASDATAIAMPALGSGVRPGIFFGAASRPGAMARSGFLSSLAGHLRPAGYATGAYMMAVSPRTLGFDLDFDDTLTTANAFTPNTFNSREYLPIGALAEWIGARLQRRPEIEDHRLVHNLFAARTVFERGLAFLQAHPARAFVWIHVGVPHAPMADVPPPGELGDQLWPPGLRWITDPMLDVATPAQMADYRRVYHNYVRFGDAELGRFVAGLRAAGLYDDAMVVVSADHGENLADAYATHARGLLTERVTRVPLVVRPPHGAPAKRDARLASSVDLVPTVLDAVYERLPEGLSGLSLQRPAPADRVVHTWAMADAWWPHAGYHAAIATYQGRFKYLLDRASADQVATETLTDYQADPEGLVDLIARERRVAERLRALQRRDNILGR